MTSVIEGNFISDGVAIGDKRATALNDWMVGLGRPATVQEMKDEMMRLKRMMPAAEDNPPWNWND